MARGDGGDYLSVSEDDALMVEADEEGFAEAPRRVLQRDYKRDGGGCLRCRCCEGCCRSVERSLLSLFVFLASLVLVGLGACFVASALVLQSAAFAGLEARSELGVAVAALAGAGALEVASGLSALCGVFCDEPCACALGAAQCFGGPAAALDVLLSFEVAARAAPLGAAVKRAKAPASGDGDDALADATAHLPRDTAIRWLSLALLAAFLLELVRARAVARLRAARRRSSSSGGGGGAADDDLELRRHEEQVITKVRTKYSDMKERMHGKYQAR